MKTMEKPLLDGKKGGEIEINPEKQEGKETAPPYQPVAGDTPLHKAAAQGDLEKVKQLKEEDEQLKKEDEQRSIFSRWVAEWTTPKCHPWARNCQGKKPIELAVQYGHLPVVRYFHHNLRFHQWLDDICEIFEHAVKYSRHNIIRWCLQQDTTSLLRRGRPEILPEMWKDKSNRNVAFEEIKSQILNESGSQQGKEAKEQKEKKAQILLDFAAVLGDLTMVRCAIKECQASVKSRALEWASMTGQLDVVKYLVEEQQANPCMPLSNGWNVLHVAIYDNHLAIVQYLLENNLVPVTSVTCNKARETVLHLSLNSRPPKRYNLEILEYLLKNYADQLDLTAMNSEHETAMSMALKSAPPGAILLLEEYEHVYHRSNCTGSSSADNAASAIANEKINSNKVRDPNSLSSLLEEFGREPSEDAIHAMGKRIEELECQLRRFKDLQDYCHRIEQLEERVYGGDKKAANDSSNTNSSNDNNTLWMDRLKQLEEDVKRLV